MIRPTTWIAAAIAIATMSSAAFADGKNEIRAVTYDEDAGMTRVLVRGAETPTFTVYKLERPSRVVLDIPRAKLADTLRGHEGASVWSPSTWAVSTIAAQQIDDGGQIVRVIVTLARPGRYDVKTEGNAVVLMMTARDAAPARVSPEALDQAKRAAASAEQARAQAQAEAERLRKVADAAQKAVDDAKRSGQQASQAELARVRAEADKAKRAATAAQAQADRARVAAEQAQREAMADANRAREEARVAKQSAADSRAQAEKAKHDASLTRAEAEKVKQQAARDAEIAAKQRAEAERVKQQAAREAEAAAKQLADAERAKQVALREAEAAKLAAAREAEQAKQAAVREATAAKQQAAREAEAARQAAAREAEAARRDLARTKAEAETARREVARAKAEVAAAQAAAKKEMDAAAAAQLAARKSIDAAQDDVAMARHEADAAKADAAKARAEADAAKHAAAADRKVAEKARAEADKMLREAKHELATLDKKTQTIQALEDKARAANAAAQAREDQARAEVARATKERAAAEAAAKQAAERAQLALKQSSSQSAALAAEAKAAEDRLAKARRATEEAEAHRTTAEAAASGAKKQLEQTRNMLTAMEQKRAQAETAANTAARKRGEAEAAASDAAQRRAEAETKRKHAEAAAQLAAQQKTEADRERFAAEQQRKTAEEAARQAKSAAEAAEKQRTIAEAAMRVASDKRKQSEASLEELNTRRLAAEKAAQDLEARSKAEAKAKAEIAAAETRKAAAAEIEKLRTEAARLAKERTAAESQLADRRKAVAAQQAEATRAEAAASAARDAASREETRRAQLAEQRVAEEKALARIKAQRAAAPPPVVAQAPAKPAPAPKPAPVVAKQAPKGPAAKINDIRFHGNDANALVDIAMSQNAAVTIGEVTATHAELIIDNAELAAKLERKLDVTKFGSPVKSVSSFRDRRTPNRVRLIAELAQPATPVFDRAQGGGKWKFVANKQVAQRPVQSVPPPQVAGFGATSTPVMQQTVSQLPPQGARGRRVYRGATVDFDFKDAPMHDLLRLIADTGRVNIVIPDNIDPKVTVRLKRVPWDQALEVILASHGLWYRRDGNLYRIAPRKELDAEDEAEAARREAAVKSEAPKSRVVPLNYASADELRSKLEPMLSPKGRIETDPRTNSLIIVDVAGNREEIERLALGLDTQTPQISIEARIVEARSTFVRQFGIQWGGRATASAAGGNATGLIFPSSVDFRGANEDGQTNRTGIVTPSDFAVNMPAATGSGEGGAVGLSLGSIGGNFAINLRLSALEDTGTIRIISAPKITVLNNKPARISQGVSIPISVISASGTNTQFVQADLALEVTPYVSQRDCAIAMNLNVTKNEPDFVNTGARGDPTILRKEAKTSMLVADGETSVLGGIYTRNSGLAYKKVPFFADIPVLGWFFKNRRENDDRTEILVFITPKITNRALLRCQ